jgi:hypothetical protein
MEVNEGKALKEVEEVKDGKEQLLGRRATWRR